MLIGLYNIHYVLSAMFNILVPPSLAGSAPPTVGVWPAGSSRCAGSHPVTLPAGHQASSVPPVEPWLVATAPGQEAPGCAAPGASSGAASWEH